MNTVFPSKGRPAAEAYNKLRVALEAAENASRSSCRTVWKIVADSGCTMCVIE